MSSLDDIIDWVDDVNSESIETYNKDVYNMICKATEELAALRKCSFYVQRGTNEL